MSNSGYLEFKMRTVIHCGADSIIRIPGLFDGLGAKRVVLLSDAGLKSVGLVERMESVFAHQAHSGNGARLVGSFSEIAADASCSSVNAALAFAREVSADGILAFGGGSVLDAAKGVKYALHHNLNDIADAVQAGIVLETWPKAQPMKIHHIAVPTTSGTGAEISDGAVLYNEDIGLKSNLLAPFSEADIAVLDPKITVGLPPSLTASTGMDALTHALEAIASPISNHLADAHAFHASKLIFKNLPLTVEDGRDINARSAMMQASTMAISGFMSALNAIPVHNCAHAFGAMFHVPHGDANAVLLPIVMEELSDFYRPHAERLAEAILLDAKGRSGQELLDAVIAELRDFQRRIGCETNFSKWNIPADKYEMVMIAIASDPAALFYPIPPESIQRIVCMAVG